MAGLLAGVFEQLVYLNRFDGLIDCAIDTKEAVKAAEKVWEDMQAGKEAKAMADLISAKSAFSSAVQQCKTEATHEALLMVEFIERTFSSKAVLVQTVSDNAGAHPEEISLKVQAYWDYSNVHGWESATALGRKVGDVAFWVLGPANPDIVL